MTPTKNGVVLNLSGHGCSLRADVYEYPGLYVFRVNNHRLPEAEEGKYDFRVLAYEDWFDERMMFGTMLVFAHNCMGTERWRRTKEEVKRYG